MPDTKHTPGPWKYEVSGGEEWTFYSGMEFNILGGAAGDTVIAVFACDTGEQLANARLMAKSPALLSICEELLESAEYWSEYFVPLGIVDRLRDAVRDAKGEKQ